VHPKIDNKVFASPCSLPTLVLVDLQQEYVAAPRALAIPDAQPALANCRAALAHARIMGFPVAFVRWITHSPFFNSATRFSHWIDGFEPTRTELVFERSQLSCYASAHFADVVGADMVLAGFAGEAACLATAVDAFHRGHRLRFLKDASASHGLNGIAPTEVHRVVAAVIGVFAEVDETSEWISATSSKITGREASHDRDQDL
jgi:nicotinamidase-related amidase